SGRRNGLAIVCDVNCQEYPANARRCHRGLGTRGKDLVTMEFSLTQDAAEEVLLERIRRLYAQIDDRLLGVADQKRLRDEIGELSKAHGKLADAREELDNTLAPNRYDES